MDKLDLFVENLQAQIFEETKMAYGQAGFQRWRHPLYSGRMENPDVHSKVTGICGDTVEIFLKFENNHVKEASYLTDGCGSSNICASFAAELAMGKTPDELADITGVAILKKIGGCPQED
ncbi:MAG: iron-sulfur cluster assembly scaffold protein [Desulfosarcina sp.]|nr:iron-sulfur cluster assembly scaffold protein [Desulfobacterales bacterium]